jgi:DNA-binding NtrC family response regulator
MSQREEVPVVSFAPPQQLTRFIHFVQSCGRPIHEVPARRWLSRKYVPARAFILFMCGGAPPIREICRLLDEQHRWTKLAAVSRSLISESASLLDRCQEIITWPCSREEMMYRLMRGLGGDGAGEERIAIERKLREKFLRLNLIGESAAFDQVLRVIERVGTHHAVLPVLITGETGTGKELAARAIHYTSARADGPFVPVNCGAIPEQLIENELFGHRAGAYTDARKEHMGLVAEAHEGTLFLDEVDALPAKAQVALLRFLQDRCFRPLGGQGYKEVDVRLVAATNADLTGSVREGRFREDLFYRLNVATVRMPALRERADDIPLLANHFLRAVANMREGRQMYLHPASVSWMRLYDWPGNIRELENTIQRAILMSDAEVVEVLPDGDEHVHPRAWRRRGWQGSGDLLFAEAKTLAIEVFEREYLTGLLGRTGGNVTRAAALAGKERRALGKLLKKHNITPRSRVAKAEETEDEGWARSSPR